MSQTHRDRVKEATEKRREYLWQKVLAVATTGIAGTLPFAGISVAIMMLGLLFYLNYIPYGLFNKNVRAFKTTC